VLFGITEVNRVDAEANVRGVLPTHGPFGNVEKVDGCLMKGFLVISVSGPIGISLLDDDFPFLNQTLQDLLNLEPFRLLVLEAQSKVLKVDKDRQAIFTFVHP